MLRHIWTRFYNSNYRKILFKINNSHIYFLLVFFNLHWVMFWWWVVRYLLIYCSLKNGLDRSLWVYLKVTHIWDKFQMQDNWMNNYPWEIHTKKYEREKWEYKRSPNIYLTSKNKKLSNIYIWWYDFLPKDVFFFLPSKLLTKV